MALDDKEHFTYLSDLSGKVSSYNNGVNPDKNVSIFISFYFDNMLFTDAGVGLLRVLINP